MNPHRRTIHVLLTLLVAGTTAAVDPPPMPPPPSPSRLAVSARNPAHPRLDPLLNQLHASRFEPSFVGERRGLDRLVVGHDSVRVVVECHGDAVGPAAAAVRALGGDVSSTYRQLVFATMPIAQLPSLAATAGVVRVRTPHRAEPSTMSEGVALHNAASLHDSGILGGGVKVGVLDCGGFSGYQGLLGTELPSSVTLWQGGSDPVGSGVHGTGCAEIVHDMAPDAELYFAHDGDEAEYYAAVDWLVAHGVDIISYSCAWIGPFPYDGSGAPHNTVNNKVEEARAAGVLFVTSSGNYADNDNYQGYYEPIPGYPWHSFDGDWSNGVFSWSGNAYTVVLTWDDWPDDPTTSGASEDYSLELWWWDGAAWQVVASSDNPQNGSPGQLPYEEISFNPPVDEWYYLVVNRVNITRNAFLSIKKSQSGGFIHYNPEYSVYVPADSPQALTVGAVHWSSLDLEPFSSQGPTLGPGGIANGGHLKPDLVAADAVSTETYGPSDGVSWPGGAGFFGTSASCPHVAGGAALLLSAEPSLSIDELEGQLLSTAIDMGAGGADTLYGHGRMYLRGALIFADGFESGDTSRW